jgi:hypothetical protein
MVGAGVGDDAVPNDGFIGAVGGGLRVRPFSGNVDEYLLRVPGEEALKVCLEGELD